tara:strand:+ start:1712 stop:3271 length:1560 start_codon:yes stop_codon:yes gene_type:complete
MKNLTIKVSILLCLNIFFSYSQVGNLDTTFGDNGIKTFPIVNEETRGKQILVLDDNSLLLGVSREFSPANSNGFYIYKLLENGELDNSFGQNGFLYFPNGSSGNSLFLSMVKQNDGKILLRCSIDGVLKLVRFDQNGEFDLAYGDNGIQTAYGGSKIALQSNGKVIIAGGVSDGFNILYEFLRYNTDGTLDLSFGNDGSVVTDITNFRFDLHEAIKILDNDKIMVVGRSYDVGDDYHPVITRFTANGFLDSSFGNNGVVISNFNSESELGEFNNVSIYNNRIIAAGMYHYSGGTGGFGGVKPAVIRFNMNGTYDESFGDQGRVILETIYNANDILWALKVQPNGKLLIGGGASAPFPDFQTNFYVSKLNYDGSLDLNFGTGGAFLTNFNNSESSYVADLELQSGGAILALGFTKNINTDDRDAIICRLENEFLGVSNFSNKSEIKIYPNPASEFIRIIGDPTILKTEIYNINGQLVYSKNYIDGVEEINQNIEFLRSGVYEILIYTIDNISINKKIIKR